LAHVVAIIHAGQLGHAGAWRTSARPDAANKTIVFEPHLPSGWENISIENLPVGSNLIAFSRTATAEGVIYAVEARENGWSFVLREGATSSARYFLNGRQIHPSSAGIRMQGRKNRVVVTSANYPDQSQRAPSGFRHAVRRSAPNRPARSSGDWIGFGPQELSTRQAVAV
jgi:hypothetical protein